MIHIGGDRIMVKKKRIQMKEIIRIAADVAEGIKFMNDHGVPYKDLNTKWILFDKNGTVCLGDTGIVAACKNVSEAMEYETDGYCWLAHGIIAGDPKTVNRDVDEQRVQFWNGGMGDDDRGGSVCYTLSHTFDISHFDWFANIMSVVNSKNPTASMS